MTSKKGKHYLHDMWEHRALIFAQLFDHSTSIKVWKYNLTYIWLVRACVLPLAVFLIFMWPTVGYFISTLFITGIVFRLKLGQYIMVGIAQGAAQWLCYHFLPIGILYELGAVVFINIWKISEKSRQTSAVKSVAAEHDLMYSIAVEYSTGEPKATPAKARPYLLFLLPLLLIAWLLFGKGGLDMNTGEIIWNGDWIYLAMATLVIILQIAILHLPKANKFSSTTSRSGTSTTISTAIVKENNPKTGVPYPWIATLISWIVALGFVIWGPSNLSALLVALIALLITLLATSIAPLSLKSSTSS